MDSILPLVPSAASLMCTDCEGRWLADWLMHWEFTTCPNCGGELKRPLWLAETVAAPRAGAVGRA